MCVLPGLVRLDLGVGGGLDVDSEEVVGVVSCEMDKSVETTYGIFLRLIPTFLSFITLSFTLQFSILP